MLHLIFQSPIETATLQRLGTGHVAVFFENAIFRLLKAGCLNQAITAQLQHNRLCVLAEELKVRGISPDDLIVGLEVIDYSELVNLTVANPVIQSWT